MRQALNKLSHPNIVHLFATFQDYGTLYYQMELMAGAFPPDPAADIMSPNLNM